MRKDTAVAFSRIDEERRERYVTDSVRLRFYRPRFPEAIEAVSRRPSGSAISADSAFSTNAAVSLAAVLEASPGELPAVGLGAGKRDHPLPDVWHSIPIDVGRRIGSQRWHRDPEDRKIVKIYLYFSNVDQGAGPLEYVPGSGFGGRYEEFRKWKARGDRYPSDGELERRIPASESVSCVGPAGTAVFCDTSGFHRGGIATTSARIVATWTFCTPAAISATARRRFTVDYAGRESELSPAARFALT
jgi:hypothetical protein